MVWVEKLACIDGPLQSRRATCDHCSIRDVLRGRIRVTDPELRLSRRAECTRMDRHSEGHVTVQLLDGDRKAIFTGDHFAVSNKHKILGFSSTSPHSLL